MVLKHAQEFHKNLTTRMAAAKAHLVSIVADEMEKYDKGEWVVLARRVARALNPDMAD